MAAVIFSEPRICDRRLRQYFDFDREQLIDVIGASVAARARCTDNDAKSAPGFYAWNAATARLRQIYRRQGWEKGDYNGIETIVSQDHRKMVAVMNTDSGTCDPLRSPRNRTPKGPASENIVDMNNQVEMFKREQMGPYVEPPFSLWYLCIHDRRGKVLAELSRPTEWNDRYIVGYGERIFILRDGEWAAVTIRATPDDGSQDFKIDVRRK
jgi:hypothetical protein